MSNDDNPLAALSRATSAAAAAAAAWAVAIRDGQGRSLSGVVWSDGRIVTAEECIAGDDPVEVLLPDGRSLPAEVAGRDPSTDVALLTAETGPIPAAAFAAAPAVGSLVLVVGRSCDGPLAALTIVSAVGPKWTSSTGGSIDALIRLDLFLPHALEGGAVVDAEGHLLGLAAADPRRRGLVIPAATLSRAVEAIESRGHVGRGYLGLAFRPVESGLMVTEVSKDGPAGAAGFLLGDIVTTWEGEPVGSMRAIARRLGPDTVGREATLGIIRAGQPSDIRVRIGERRRG